MSGMALAQSQYDSQGPPDEVEPPSDERVRELAYSFYLPGWRERNIEITDDARVERDVNGYWVTARLWVPEEEVE
jgi:hypothetical protein